MKMPTLSPPNHPGRTHKTEVVVLLSGGIDSAATVLTFPRSKFMVSGLHFDYGQAARRTEWSAAERLGVRLKIPVHRLRLGFRPFEVQGEFAARNALLVLTCAAVTPSRPLVIAAGIHQGVPYYDAQRGFVSDLQRVLDGYFSGGVQLAMPFIDASKRDVVRFARRHKLSLALTYSCEKKEAPACRTCPSCLDREVLRVD
jgi:7-cyano-7-deazaguanine synthase